MCLFRQEDDCLSYGKKDIIFSCRQGLDPVNSLQMIWESGMMSVFFTAYITKILHEEVLHALDSDGPECW